MSQHLVRGVRDVQEVIDAFLAAVRARFGEDLITVVLFGSVARGTATDESDIDLLVVAQGLPGRFMERTPISVAIRQQVEPALARLADRTGWQPYLSTIYLAPPEAADFRRIYLDMVDEAVVLFDRGGFFARVLEGVRERIRAWGARKVPIGDSHYWQLIPDYAPGKKVEW